MPILIAVAFSLFVVTLVLALVARRSRRIDAGRVPTAADGLVEQARRHPSLRRFVLARRDTTTATGQLLTLALGAITGLILLMGLVLQMVQAHAGFARWDAAAARWGGAHTRGTAESVFRVVTQLGSTPVVIAVGVVAAVVGQRHAPTRAVPVFLATVIGSQLALANLIKVVVRRDRPNVARLVAASGFSFPSGHAAASAAVYAAAALVVGRGRGRRANAVLAGVAAGIAAAVAASRVLLGAHWLTDVIAGAALGWTCFALCSIAFGGRLLHFGAPAERAGAVLAAAPSPTNAPASATHRSST
jgi:undecaprenyl-diphosphatase